MCGCRFESPHLERNRPGMFAWPASFLAPRVGFEPTTLRLTAGCSAIELLRNIGKAFAFPIGIRQRSTLPGRLQPSTIDAEGLNFCVRDGNRWNPFAIVTGNGIITRASGLKALAQGHLYASSALLLPFRAPRLSFSFRLLSAGDHFCCVLPVLSSPTRTGPLAEP